jgi:hypothetical protein
MNVIVVGCRALLNSLKVGAVTVAECALGVEGRRTRRLLLGMIGRWSWEVASVKQVILMVLIEFLEIDSKSILYFFFLIGPIDRIMIGRWVVNGALGLVLPMFGVRHVGLMIVEKVVHCGSLD